MFVDRVRELETRNSLYRRPGSSLVVVYGRRRLGKTTLLREFAKDKVALYYLRRRVPVHKRSDGRG